MKEKLLTSLVDAFETAFPMAKAVNFEGDSYIMDKKNRGRQESTAALFFYGWSGLRAVGIVKSFRQA